MNWKITLFFKSRHLSSLAWVKEQFKTIQQNHRLLWVGPFPAYFHPKTHKHFLSRLKYFSVSTKNKTLFFATTLAFEKSKNAFHFLAEAAYPLHCEVVQCHSMCQLYSPVHSSMQICIFTFDADCCFKWWCVAGLEVDPGFATHSGGFTAPWAMWNPYFPCRSLGGSWFHCSFWRFCSSLYWILCSIHHSKWNNLRSYSSAHFPLEIDWSKTNSCIGVLPYFFFNRNTSSSLAVFCNHCSACSINDMNYLSPASVSK